MSDPINKIMDARFYVLGACCEIGNDIINMRGGFPAFVCEFIDVNLGIVDKLFERGASMVNSGVGGAVIVAIIVSMYGTIVVICTIADKNACARRCWGTDPKPCLHRELSHRLGGCVVCSRTASARTRCGQACRQGVTAV